MFLHGQLKYRGGVAVKGCAGILPGRFGLVDIKYCYIAYMVPLPKVNSECRNKEKQRDILSWKKFDTHLQ